MDIFTQENSSSESSQVLASINDNVRRQTIARRTRGHLFKKNSFLDKYFDYDINGKGTARCRTCYKLYTNRCHSRLITHLERNCKGSNFNPDVMLEEIETTVMDLNKLFVKAIIAGNWSFNSIETKELKHFMSKLTTKWNIPSRQDVSSKYIPRMSQQLMEQFIKDLDLNAQLSITVMFDHWEDASHRSFLGIIATHANGRRILLDIRDVSLRGHYASVTVDEMVEVLKDLPKKAINSIVSDSASACNRARKDMVSITQFKHVIQHRCMAHHMNLIGVKVTAASERIKATIKQASHATGIISGSVYIQNYIRSLNINRPQVACPVRWYSTISMIRDLIELKSVILEKIVPEVDESKSDVFMGLDWAFLKEIYETLKPLCECIGKVERSDISLGEAMKCILEYARELFDEDKDNVGPNSTQTGSNLVKLGARRAFLHYFSESKLGREELGLLIAAYVLDRRFKLDYMTDEAIELSFEAISRIAINSGSTFEQIQTSLIVEFDHYRQFKQPFSITSEDPVNWWRERANTGPLGGIGLRFAHLKASSANIERTFSTLKLIQGDYRFNLMRETLLHTARVKIALKDVNAETLMFDEDYTYEKLANLSLNDSDRSDDEIANITIQESPTWIENETVATKKTFQSFFKYINFAKITEAQYCSQQPLQEVTPEQIRELIRTRLRPQESDCVIVDTQSQIQALDDLMSKEL